MRYLLFLFLFIFSFRLLSWWLFLSLSFPPEIKDVALGMAYLEEQGVHHRNLHSHNVLVTKEWGAKVSASYMCTFISRLEA